MHATYYWKIDGQDSVWTSLKEPSLRVSGLPYGHMILRIKAQAGNGTWGRNELLFNINVIKPIYLRTWFIVLEALILIIGIVCIYRWRERNMRIEKEKLERTVEKRTEELDVQRLRAERSEQFNKQFLANMSHEIRTPMNAVIGMTSLVLDTPLQEKQKYYIEGIRKSSDNLLHIINDILDLSKIEAGKMELEQIDFSLKNTIEQVMQTLAHRADEKGLQLIADIDHSIPDVLIGDPVRLNQVLINLVGNAIKFTEKGSVTIEVKKVRQQIKFSIIDTGIGIPENKLQTVFDNFSQANTSDTRKYGGTGLGLSISRQLVDIMGGNITIESEVASGTTFSFILDLENGSEERLQQRLAADRQVDGSILDGLSILVVDDNEYNRIVAKDTLKQNLKQIFLRLAAHTKQ